MSRALIVAGIVLLYLLRASDTFVSDHSTGDQRSYIGLAMKMERAGLTGYNLFHISRVDVPGGLEYVWSDEPDGELLDAFRADGIGFFAHTLFHTPPLYPYIISLSHRVLAPDIGYQVLFPEPARRAPVGERLKVQLYSSIVGLCFGAILIVATYLLARMFFGFWISALGALLIACSPAVVFASERIWQDVPLAALITLTMVFLFRYAQSGGLGSLFMSVICYGLALLTKNTAALLAPVVVMAMGMGPHDPRREVGKMLGKTAISAGIFFALVAILVFPWFLIAWRTWGTPFYNAGEAGITSVHSWFAFLNGRPWYTYLVSIPVMVPLYLLGFYRIITVWRSGARFGDVILAIWFLVFLVVVTVVAALSEQLGPDARYMLPAYPPLAILTAAQIGRLMDGQKGKVPGAVLRWGLVAALLMTCAWSFWLTEPSRMEFPRIYDNFMNVPF